jgi:hypothetical protein
MAASKPKFPAGGPKTIEVDSAWLDEEEKPRSKKAKAPPPIPGAKKRAPPMPVERTSLLPKRRETMEVKAEWLESSDGEGPPSKRNRSRASLVPVKRKDSLPPAKPKDKKGPPIPREE